MSMLFCQEAAVLVHISNSDEENLCTNVRLKYKVENSMIDVLQILLLMLTRF